MDQVKKILGVVLKYRFWLISLVIILLPLGGWFTTTSKLRTEFDTRKGAIKSKFDAVNQIASAANHPNQFSEAGMDEFVKLLSDDVTSAWRQKYQRQEEILVWPKELGDDFIAKVDAFKPIESLAFPTPALQELPKTDRERYRDYIKEELPKLAAIIGAQWRPPAHGGGMGGSMSGYGSEGSMGGMGMEGYGGAMSTGMGSGMGSGMAMGGPAMPGMVAGAAAEKEKEIVVWDPADQARLQNLRFDWTNTKDKAPRTLDILYSQEDLWVLNALMRIIAKTNRDATAQYNATIKQISYIDLGRFVGRNYTRITRVTAGPAAGMGYGGEMGSGMISGEYNPNAETGSSEPSSDEGAASGDASMGSASYESSMAMSGAPGEGGSEMGSGMGGAVAVAPDPANMRYVDTNYVPIPAERLRLALSPDNRNPEDAFLVVAKRIPIRLGLLMDQRKVHRLIAECGNSNLIVEVRQVRINRQRGSSAGGYGSGGSSMGGMMGAMSGPSMGSMGGEMSMGGMGGEMSMGGMSGSEAESGSGSSMYGSEGPGGMSGSGMPGGGPAGSDRSPYDLPVEIYGMVYIYNPVNVAKLGIEQASAETAPGTTNEAAPTVPQPGEAPAPAATTTATGAVTPTT